MGLFDFLFDDSSFDPEDWRDVGEDRRHRASCSANWTDREDWDSDDDDNPFSGFDIYEDNDF